MDGDDLTVKVSNGTVRLTGTVGSRKEAEEAIENAYEGGAVRVIDELRAE